MDVMRLCPEDIEAIARRVVELQREAGDGQVPAELLTAAQVARRFGVERSWVYAHADELDPIRLGGGRKPRLRFDAEKVDVALRARSAGERSGTSASALRRAFAGDAARVAPQSLERLPERWRRAVDVGGRS